MVAGPIERASRILPQLQKPRRIVRDDILIGATWILTGYFFKVVIADTVAPFVDFHYTYPFPLERSGLEDLAAIFAFGLQIFGDFAGYSLIARGIARTMGIHLMRNFRNPYLAISPRDFWR